MASLGTAASNHTTLWQSLPEGPVITIPAGSSNVPVEERSGFVVGQKIALGYGSTYPDRRKTVEQYEVATVTAVGKPGTQAYLAMDAPAGATNIKVTSLADISAGDKIRLDIDSVGHGIETVTVAHVGTAANQTNLSAPASAGATRHQRAPGGWFCCGRQDHGRHASEPRNRYHHRRGQRRVRTVPPSTSHPPLQQPHVASEWVVSPGTGLDLAAPLRFNHAANLPFSDRGTGISFQPATAFAHSSNEPVQALGTGITLDRPLANGHAIDAAVRDAAVKTAGYQGTPAPNQWFGGPELTTEVSRNSAVFSPSKKAAWCSVTPPGVVADSLNYGGLVDPWAAEGDQADFGAEQAAATRPAPGAVFNPWVDSRGPLLPSIRARAGSLTAPIPTATVPTFSTQAASLSAASDAGATNIKVASTEGFQPGQTIRIDSGANAETAIVSTAGTAGATTLRASTGVGATVLPAKSVTGFRKGQIIKIDEGVNSETAVVSSSRDRGAATITVVTPLARGHTAGAQISGSGISFTIPLTRPHANGTQVSDYVPTPGAPNQYHGRNH